jgi:hypothetical protein
MPAYKCLLYACDCQRLDGRRNSIATGSKQETSIESVHKFSRIQDVSYYLHPDLADMIIKEN